MRWQHRNLGLASSDSRKDLYDLQGGNHSKCGILFIWLHYSGHGVDDRKDWRAGALRLHPSDADRRYGWGAYRDYFKKLAVLMLIELRTELLDGRYQKLELRIKKMEQTAVSDVLPGMRKVMRIRIMRVRC